MSYQAPNANGQTTMSASSPVVIASDQSSLPVSLSLNKVRVETEFTRPADTTAYTIGDVVSNSTSSTTLIDLSGVARANAGTGYIVSVTLTTDKKSITPRFRIHFYNDSAPTVAADNAAHKQLYADIAKYIGYIDTPAMVTPADSTNSTMSRTYDGTQRLPYKAGASTTHLYAVLEALDAFTPASGQKFTLSVMAEQD